MGELFFPFRLPFTMLVLQKAMKMVCSFPEVKRVAYAFMLVVLMWMALWSFGASGLVASSFFEVRCWWVLLVSPQVLLLLLAFPVGSGVIMAMFM